MANPVFPVALAAIQDSKYLTIEYEDKAVKGEVEGGYTHTRPRHTRRPRRKFTTGFTEITQAEFNLLEAFYDQVGTYTKFDWTNPATGEVFVVRFDKQLKAKYEGMGPTRLYTLTSIELQEV